MTLNAIMWSDLNIKYITKQRVNQNKWWEAPFIVGWSAINETQMQHEMKSKLSLERKLPLGPCDAME